MDSGPASRPSAILIGPNDVMKALRERVHADAGALSFADSEPLQALQAIRAHMPPLVVIERLFAATSRGAGLIKRIKADASLSQLEVRVVSHTGHYQRTVSKPVAHPDPVEPLSTAVVVAEEPAHPLAWHDKRRAPRFRIRPGVEIQVDGNAARVVDLSTIGAQVLCAKSLRPNQKTRVTIPAHRDTTRFRASIAWARFELAKPPSSPHYRVGIAFIDADPGWLGVFCHKNRA